VYILGRCPANDQQLMYSDIRLDDIKEMISNSCEIGGVDFNDCLRFFKGIILIDCLESASKNIFVQLIELSDCALFSGDAPACQLEIGQQKGGRFFCWFCSMDANRCEEIDYMYAAERADIETRIKKLRSTR